jgi:dUTPase
VILINLSTGKTGHTSGDRIAQMVLQQVERVNWVKVEAINETSQK